MSDMCVSHCSCLSLQVVIIFLQKMDILLAKTPKDDVRDHVLPMVCKALETAAEQLQVLVNNNSIVS